MRLAVTVPEAADMIGISESKLSQLLAAGDIAKVKIGRRTVIRVAELERYLEAAQADRGLPEAGLHLIGLGNDERPVVDEAPPVVASVRAQTKGRNRD
jgi:excisionase family DNA binding protein